MFYQGKLSVIPKINIYQYTDYRKYISDWIDRERKINRKFSFRKFNQSVGINSSAFLPLIIKGSRNIGEEGIYAIIKGFGLTERQGNYFRDLVAFNHAETATEKDQAYRKLNEYSKSSKQMDVANYNLFSKWYYVAILELLRLENNKKKNLNYILNNLKPSVGKTAVKKAIFELEQIGVLTENKDRSFSVNYEMISTPNEFISLAICNLHAEMSLLARKSVQEDDPEIREFSGITIAVSEEGFDLAKKKIQEFRKELHEILENNKTGKKNIVCQFNFQQFQLNQNFEGKKNVN